MRTTRGWKVSTGCFAVTVSLAVLSILATTLTQADCYRVLAVETLPGKSHWNFMSAVLRALTDAGHEVTVFTPFPDGNRENYTEVDTSGEFSMRLDLDVMYMMETMGSAITLLGNWSQYCSMHCDIVHRNERLVNLMDDGQRAGFDVIIVEPKVADCVSRLAHALNAPIVYVIPSSMFSESERAYTGHFSNPSYVSHILSRHAVPSTFAQRFANTALLAYSVLVTAYQEWTAKLTDPRPYDLSPTVDPSVIFQNSHYISQAPRPVTANLVNVGGIRLKPSNGIPDVSDYCFNCNKQWRDVFWNKKYNKSVTPGR